MISSQTPHLKLVPDGLLRNSTDLHQSLDQPAQQPSSLLQAGGERRKDVPGPGLAVWPGSGHARPEFHRIPEEEAKLIGERFGHAPNLGWVPLIIRQWVRRRNGHGLPWKIKYSRE